MTRAAGFTILELLVATGAALLVLAAVGGTCLLERRLLERETQALELRESLRRSLDLTGRELRAAGFDPISGGDFQGERDGLWLAEPDRVEVRFDLHGSTATSPPDGVIDERSDERIGFIRHPVRRTLQQAVGDQVLALTADRAVSSQGFLLRYFDGCGNELLEEGGGGLPAADRIEVNRVRIQLTLEGPDGAAITGTTDVALRNRPGKLCP